jgi:DNA-binding MarR family transcriptional regulator
MPKAPARNRDAEIAQRLLKHWHEAVPNDRMAHLVKDASRSFLRSLQVRLSRHDVSLGHWTFLRILWERDGITQRELSNEAGVMEPTTAIALQAMEKLGYIQRQRLAGNRKNSYIFLTPAGKRLKRVLVPLAEDVNTVALRGITQAEIAATRRALLVMIDNLASDSLASSQGTDSAAR